MKVFFALIFKICNRAELVLKSKINLLYIKIMRQYNSIYEST